MNDVVHTSEPMLCLCTSTQLSSHLLAMGAWPFIAAQNSTEADMQGRRTSHMMHSIIIKWCRDDHVLLMDVRPISCSCTSTQLCSHLDLLQVCAGQRALSAAPGL